MRYPNLLDSIFDVSTAVEHEHALIWRDVQWRERQPFLRLEPVVLADASGGTSIKPSGDIMSVPVTPGAFLGLRLALDAAGNLQKFCTGYTRGNTETGQIQRVACPQGNRLESGKQCEYCAAHDEFTALHTAHLYAGTLTPGMRAYAQQPHRLYIATFPDGSSKVGTSSQHSTPRRLDEQAVATATYIAQAPDGLLIREAEDAVTRIANIPQVKQVASKYRAWTEPLPGAQLRAAHQNTVERAHEALTESGLLAQLTALDESWVPSVAMNRPYAALRAQNPEPLDAFPSILKTREAGFFCTGAAGKFVTAHVGDPDAAVLINTAELANYVVEPADILSAVTVQTSLF